MDRRAGESVGDSTQCAAEIGTEKDADESKGEESRTGTGWVNRGASKEGFQVASWEGDMGEQWKKIYCR